MPLLVWIAGTKGFEPQIWMTDQLTGEGKRRIHPVKEVKITAEEAVLGLNELVKRYDAPAQA